MRWSLLLLLIIIGFIRSGRTLSVANNPPQPQPQHLSMQSSIPSTEEEDSRQLVELLHFCSIQQEPGLYCHPSENRFQIFCPVNIDQFEPAIYQCPDAHVCRIHQKLYALEDGEGVSLYSNGDPPIQNSRFKQFPQCVPISMIDLDAFCEDKLHDFHQSASAAETSDGDKEKSVRDLMSEYQNPDGFSLTNLPQPWNETAVDNGIRLLTAVRHCNPFSFNRKHVLDCLAVERKCLLSDDKGKIMYGFLLNIYDGIHDLVCQQIGRVTEIIPVIKECAGYDVCRRYEQDLRQMQQSYFASCFPFADALCRDRFWELYAGDIVASSTKSSSISSAVNNPAARDRLRQTVSQFRFCDPFKTNVQLECTVDIEISLTEFDSNSATVKQLDGSERLKPRPTSFDKKLFGSSAVEPAAKFSHQISVSASRIRHFQCPSDRLYAPITDSNGHQTMVISGPICRQFTPKFSRCMTRPGLEISARQMRQAKEMVLQRSNSNDSVNDKDISSTTTSSGSPAQKSLASTAAATNTIIITGPYMGFCYQHSTPGQYCIAGTPEAGVLCPQGIRIQCRRSRQLATNDLSLLMERCSQHFGPIPTASEDALDPFRKHQVLDVFGNPLSEGWYASCAQHHGVVMEK